MLRKISVDGFTDEMNTVTNSTTVIRHTSPTRSENTMCQPRFSRPAQRDTLLMLWSRPSAPSAFSTSPGDPAGPSG